MFPFESNTFFSRHLGFQNGCHLVTAFINNSKTKQDTKMISMAIPTFLGWRKMMVQVEIDFDGSHLGIQDGRLTKRDTTYVTTYLESLVS